MKHIYRLFLAFWLLPLLPAAAQTPTWQQLTVLVPDTKASNCTLEGSTQGNGNDVYVTGHFRGTLQLGSITLTSVDNDDIFVACWNSLTNTWVWAQQASGPGNEQIASIATSGSSIYIVGEHKGAMTFGTAALAATANTDLYVAKLTTTATSGTWSWVQAAGAGAAKASGGIAVNGNAIYIGGWYSAATRVGSTDLKLNDLSYTNGFVAKLTDNGTTASWGWVLRQSAPNGSSSVNALAANENGLFVLGNGATTSFGNSTVVASGSGSTVVAKIIDAGASATYAWGVLGGSYWTSPWTIAVSGNNIYVGGDFHGTARFGSTILDNRSLSSANGYVAKLLDAGTAANFQWAQTFVTKQENRVLGLAVNGNSIYACGEFLGDMALGTTTLPSLPGDVNVFLAKLVDAGNSSSFTWAKQAGSSTVDGANLLTITPTGRLCMGGSVGSGIFFDNLPIAAPSYGAYLAVLTDVVPLATASAKATLDLSVYPNPVTGTATLRYELPTTGRIKVEVRDVVGRCVSSFSPEAAQLPGPHTLVLPSLQPGHYTVQLYCNEAVSYRAILVK